MQIVSVGIIAQTGTPLQAASRHPPFRGLMRGTSGAPHFFFFMSDKLSDYNYYLPEQLIADSALSDRSSSRMMHLKRSDKSILHEKFSDLEHILQKGDLLILNNTKVFKARVFASAQNRLYKNIEIILLKNIDNHTWQVLLRKMRKFKSGQKFTLHNSQIIAELISKDEENGTAILQFNIDSQKIIEYADINGEIPLPNYIKNPKNVSLPDYQTTFADSSKVGSVAAPTAGRHFTPELLQKLKAKGVIIEYITLHIGIGTFQPIWQEDLNHHQMHAEQVYIGKETMHSIELVKKDGGRIIAVGTTVVRSLEGVFAIHDNWPKDDFSGEVNLFIKPGFKFQVIDCLITNFHLPQTTLLVLVSAFAGREFILQAYNEAINRQYRFYSLGDSMFIE